MLMSTFLVISIELCHLAFSQIHADALYQGLCAIQSGDVALVSCQSVIIVVRHHFVLKV